MNVYRIKHTLGLHCIMGGMERGGYLKKHKIFHYIGNNVCFMPRKIPLYPNLISIGNNVIIASGVLFLTHDAISQICNNISKEQIPELQHKFKENIGCIKIEDNVFVGANSMICTNIHIGKNVIIAAGTVVTKDIPSNSVVGGNPAKIICKFDEFYRRRMEKNVFPDSFHLVMGTNVNEKLAKWMWNKFDKEH